MLLAARSPKLAWVLRAPPETGCRINVARIWDILVWAGQGNMTDRDVSQAIFRRSTFSDAGEGCVEAATRNMRNSEVPNENTRR